MPSMFHCPPNCEKRKPGCHSTCEQHQKDKAAYNARKAELEKYKSCDDYSVGIVTRVKDYQAKHSRARRGGRML